MHLENGRDTFALAFWMWAVGLTWCLWSWGENMTASITGSCLHTSLRQKDCMELPSEYLVLSQNLGWEGCVVLGTFELQLIPKHQTRWNGFCNKILSLDARGMTVWDI